MPFKKNVIYSKNGYGYIPISNVKHFILWDDKSIFYQENELYFNQVNKKSKNTDMDLPGFFVYPEILGALRDCAFSISKKECTTSVNGNELYLNTIYKVQYWDAEYHTENESSPFGTRLLVNEIKPLRIPEWFKNNRNTILSLVNQLNNTTDIEFATFLQDEIKKFLPTEFGTRFRYESNIKY